MKKLLLLSATLLLSGCDPKAQDVTYEYPIMPKELEHCRIFEIANVHGSTLEVVYCGDKTDTTTCAYRNKKMECNGVIYAPVSETDKTTIQERH